MEINIITKNLDQETIRVNLANSAEDFSTVTISQYNKKNVLLNKIEISVKSLANFIKEMEKEKLEI